MKLKNKTTRDNIMKNMETLMEIQCSRMKESKFKKMTFLTYMSLGNVSGLDDLSFHCDVEPTVDQSI